MTIDSRTGMTQSQRPDYYRIIMDRNPDGDRVIVGREPVVIGQRREALGLPAQEHVVFMAPTPEVSPES